MTMAMTAARGILGPGGGCNGGDSIAEEQRGLRYNWDITPCSSAVSCSSRGGSAGLAVFDAGYHVDRHSEVELGVPRGDNYKSLTFTPTQTIACPRRVRYRLFWA